MRLSRFFDLMLSFATSVLATVLLLPFVALSRPLWGRRLRRGRRIVVTLARMNDTSEVHLRLNDREYLHTFFHRPGADFVIVLCAGDGKHCVTRFGRRVVAVDIKLPTLPRVERITPRTLRVLRDILALLVTGRFLLARNAAVLEAMAPSQLMWRATLLKWALNPILMTQVRGNLDLIYAAGTPARGRPLRQALEMFSVMRLKSLAQIYFRSCDAVIGLNINNMENAISNGSHPAKTFLSRIRIDRTILSSREGPRKLVDFMPTEGATILLWSRLAHEKMVMEALDIVMRVLILRPTAYFVVIGDGELRHLMESRLETTPIASRVIFAGYRTRQEIAAAARWATMALIPYGGSSLVEAGLLGLPTAAFDIEWHRELVREGETGWLLDWRLPDISALSLAQALDDAAGMATRAERLKLATHMMFDEETIEQRERILLEKIFSLVDTVVVADND